MQHIPILKYLYVCLGTPFTPALLQGLPLIILLSGNRNKAINQYIIIVDSKVIDKYKVKTSTGGLQLLVGRWDGWCTSTRSSNILDKTHQLASDNPSYSRHPWKLKRRLNFPAAVGRRALAFVDSTSRRLD